MAQTSKVGKTATTITYGKAEGDITVKYHSTEVVKVEGGVITLNSGGWRTNTTKNRMNQASNQFDLGFTVSQESFNWYITHKGQSFNFLDGIKLIK
jgi:hypothetical protein